MDGYMIQHKETDKFLATVPGVECEYFESQYNDPGEWVRSKNDACVFSNKLTPDFIINRQFSEYFNPESNNDFWKENAKVINVKLSIRLPK